MKKVTRTSIINIDKELFDNKFLFSVPTELSFDWWVDLSVLLAQRRNEKLDFKKDYKLWSEVYSPKDELEIFKIVFDDAVSKGKKIHVTWISLDEEVNIVKSLYNDLGYFDNELNRYEVDFQNAPITIWVNIKNIIYSFKDYKSLKEKILIIPPPREPRHQKAMITGINSQVISTISLTWDDEEYDMLKYLIKEEKTNLSKLANNLCFNFGSRWFVFEEKELILDLY